MAEHIGNSLQAKLYSILTGSPALMALVNAVYDNPPDDVPMPYVVIGDESIGDFGAHDFDGFDGTITIHAWDEVEGRKKVRTILEQIYRLLHNTNLQIPGFKTIVFRCILSEIIPDPDDNRTYHGIQRYNLLTGGN